MANTDFENLSLNERAQLIWSKAVFIDSRSNYGFIINLYGMDRNYFEVWYNPIHNRIEKVEKLTDEKRIESYLVKIN